ncbi:hypothetical protein AB7M45_007835 [Bradyrhizobium elkanii]|uniref:hypothetical protein n=1 Tax=Bradyrhizobium elkanii TaxID=29448 RepID=UPI00092055C8|nr:hypothetical protein [Bradyrhizobium elkanii]MCW2195062.1 hypothetical protein [Bradyrhizobium elkanii]NWL67245.1 hypothetical protein [Bradyrhizobium elkanii]OIM94090.1 hypothetical protein BLN97_12515 [Bradyrhizobium elkanii]
MASAQLLIAAGFRVTTRAEFDAATDVPAGMRLVATRIFKRWGGDFVVYDPAGGDDGWLLIDYDRDQIIGETIEHLGRLAPPEPPAPAQGSLF